MLHSGADSLAETSKRRRDRLGGGPSRCACQAVRSTHASRTSEQITRAHPRVAWRAAGDVLSNPSVQRPITSTDPVTGPTRKSHRRVVVTTCQAHGAAGFTNLLVTKEDGFIVLNPHVGNCCVLRLDEQATTALYQLLGEWLGYEPVSAVGG